MRAVSEKRFPTVQKSLIVLPVTFFLLARISEKRFPTVQKSLIVLPVTFFILARISEKRFPMVQKSLIVLPVTFFLLAGISGNDTIRGRNQLKKQKTPDFRHLLHIQNIVAFL